MSDNDTQHVVYAMDSENNPTHMLAVVSGIDELEDAMNKWWKAFHTGEKATPRDYDGVSHRPVADFDQWADGDDSDE